VAYFNQEYPLSLFRNTDDSFMVICIEESSQKKKLYLLVKGFAE